MSSDNHTPEAECVFTFRMSRPMSEGITSIAKKYHLTKSQLVRTAIRTLVSLHNQEEGAAETWMFK